MTQRLIAVEMIDAGAVLGELIVAVAVDIVVAVAVDMVVVDTADSDCSCCSPFDIAKYTPKYICPQQQSY